MAGDYALMAMIQQYESQAREQQRRYNDSKNKAAIITNPDKKKELLKQADLHRKKAIKAKAKAEHLKKNLTQREERQRERQRTVTKREVAKKVTKETAKARAKAKEEEARKIAREAAKAGKPKAQGMQASQKSQRDSEGRIKENLKAMEEKRRRELSQKGKMQQTSKEASRIGFSSKGEQRIKEKLEKMQQQRIRQTTREALKPGEQKMKERLAEQKRLAMMKAMQKKLER